ncbi:hypothetical protein HPB52_002665 [Rhipicephalus sanguineus]|uniref:Uncharacterized protein n=1 Tax=Rhipicephalus sanguineus TaxID=34632 RepID=A0A9D4PC55_RHISA|nr:hypothetical protein HPB52_002665 [Rhipicephalus sanguineus]
MLPRVHPPLKPFKPVYSRALFTKLDVILELNGVTAQPMMRANLLNALPPGGQGPRVSLLLVLRLDAGAS